MAFYHPLFHTSTSATSIACRSPSGKFQGDNGIDASNHDSVDDCKFCEYGEYLSDPDTTTCSPWCVRQVSRAESET